MSLRPDEFAVKQALLLNNISFILLNMNLAQDKGFSNTDIQKLFFLVVDRTNEMHQKLFGFCLYDVELLKRTFNVSS